MMGETMNKNQLHAMLKNYVDNFERVNNEEHEEYYLCGKRQIKQCIEK